MAPLAALLDGVWLPLPNIAYGGLTLLAACTALLLPETRRAQLPETIQDVERMRCAHRAGGGGCARTCGCRSLRPEPCSGILGHVCECAQASTGPGPWET